MKYINDEKIFGLIAHTGSSQRPVIEKILMKALELKRLTLQESAVLLNTDDPHAIDAIYECAAYVKEAIYGKRIVLFVPLYISNLCSNDCKYCAFRVDNRALARVTLSEEQVQRQVACCLLVATNAS
jgi:2-iminoacetate synthase